MADPRVEELPDDEPASTNPKVEEVDSDDDSDVDAGDGGKTSFPSPSNP